jgi:hypothetical protein
MNGAAPGHLYFEACVHAGGSAEHPLPALLSMHPRYACDFLKPAAPLEVSEQPQRTMSRDGCAAAGLRPGFASRERGVAAKAEQPAAARAVRRCTRRRASCLRFRRRGAAAALGTCQPPLPPLPPLYRFRAPRQPSRIAGDNTSSPSQEALPPLHMDACNRCSLPHQALTLALTLTPPSQRAAPRRQPPRPPRASVRRRQL